eukprot:SAG11_NODE_17669_length_512_cov_0.748184_2_plen_30_part_01
MCSVQGQRHGEAKMAEVEVNRGSATQQSLD